MNINELKEAVEVVKRAGNQVTWTEESHRLYMKSTDILLDLAQLVIECSEVMPDKVQVSVHEPQDAFDEGYNKAIDDMTLALTKKMVGLEEDCLGNIEIPIDTNPMYVEETNNPAVIKLKSKYANIIANAIREYMLGGKE